MDRLRPWPVAALVAWTLFTWGNRIPLLWSDDSQSTGAKVSGTVPIAVFVVLAVVALVALLRSGPELEGGARVAALTLAGWSVAYWLVRLPLILIHDHAAAFKAVHSVLAAVAIGLSIWAIGRLLRTNPDRSYIHST